MQAPYPTDNLDWINELPIETIAAIAAAATSALAEKKRAEEERLWQQFKEQAEKLGIDPATFAAAKLGHRSVRPKKYRGPNGEEWNGRGLGLPQWLKELVDAGRDKEEFINPEWAKSKGMVN